MSSICDFSFNIANWQIVCNKALSQDDWQAGEKHWYESVAKRENYAPKLAFLPPLKRRRLSESARLFFEAAWELLPEGSNVPVVYASLNSEINRSFALWQSLLTEGDVSPTSFSLSVHNALIGQWSEMRKITEECTALTAQKDSLEIALLEAYLLLEEGHSQVLVVVAESPLSEEYNAAPIYRQPFSYALAMVVEKGENWQLSLKNQPLAEQDRADNALNWVKHQHLNSSQWQNQSSRGGSWLWRKN